MLVAILLPFVKITELRSLPVSTPIVPFHFATHFLSSSSPSSPTTSLTPSPPILPIPNLFKISLSSLISKGLLKLKKTSVRSEPISQFIMVDWEVLTTMKGRGMRPVASVFWGDDIVETLVRESVIFLTSKHEQHVSPPPD